jgi:hypothetical protein
MALVGMALVGMALVGMALVGMALVVSAARRERRATMPATAPRTDGSASN